MSKILKYYDQIKPRFTRSCFLLSSCSKNEVHCVKWWMAHYQSSTPKRYYAYCNSHYIHRLDKGVLQGWKKHKDQKVVTAVHYTDASGKKRYKGTKQLRSTETLDLYQFLLWVCVCMNLFWSDLSVAYLNHIVSVVGTFQNHVFI